VAEPFVDTSIIIRLVTGDDLAKQAAAAQFFKDVEDGTLSVRAPVTMIADAVFVLAGRRTYNLPRAQIAAALTRLVGLPHFRVQDRAVVLRALELYGSSTLDFGDAMILAAMEAHQSQQVYSYDGDFDGIAGVIRLEP
jgi:predicted nucleic acid-binding protein